MDMLKQFNKILRVVPLKKLYCAFIRNLTIFVTYFKFTFGTIDHLARWYFPIFQYIHAVHKNLMHTFSAMQFA